ncbi:uncharacterized protein K452DRAFT_72428 [Aplosporella prunicola CBS 121167]|uniref:Uncharacterized protein n=1 Tax=Aplosporella prunicola CBS 121167 TaxID=1176127 RepID=A0A6A6BSC6_9PEZI|nr:uncharacterized protein K452DRAFT_72428 [Aplosporella prunicola CBS 121167]KAF2146900.1 hypothetical protein K452DRAFT_72428 [Aplosporella prunicola CBS 121167]
MLEIFSFFALSAAPIEWASCLHSLRKTISVSFFCCCASCRVYAVFVMLGEKTSWGLAVQCSAVLRGRRVCGVKHDMYGGCAAL